jgi:transcriptional regulator with XRE-family HTH domain
MNIDVTTFDLLLRKNGMTQAALAERANIGTKTVGRIRRGEPLRTTNVKKIADALGVSIEELIAPPTDVLAERAEKRSGLHRVVVDLEGQAINALTITAKHYRVSEKAVLAAAPLMFSILAELSLKQRRDKLAAWKEATLSAMETGPKTHEDFTISSIMDHFWDLYYTERDSIDARDLSGGFKGEHPELVSEETPGNPFLTI